MSNICEFCLNYESEKDSSMKTKELCKNSCFTMDENEGMLVCSNFALVICPNLSSAVIERFLRKDIDFYDNLCDLTSIILSMYSYQDIFKIIFDIEHGQVEFIDLTNSQATYGKYNLNSIEIQKGIVTFETESDLRNLILSVVKGDSLVFIEFEDFEYKYPIKGVFAKPNRFFNKNTLALKMHAFSNQEVW